MKNGNPNGIHYLIEFFGCDKEQINSVDFWKEALNNSVKGTSMEILHSYFHEFKPCGITGFVLLSSSHISVHTWPNRDYVACDIFTCATEEDTNIAFERLKNEVSHKHMNSQKINRGYQFLSLPIFCSGEQMKLEIKNILYEKETSARQKTIIVDSVDYGKCLIIDDVMQTAESDHEIYDQEMLKFLRKTDKNVLILGGGDGYIAQMALEKNPNLKIRVIDLDIEIVKCAKKYLDQKIFDNKSVELFIGDALHFLKVTKEKYDGIICDLTDVPIGTKKEEKEFRGFFEKIIFFSESRLEEGGWISVQSGASSAAEGFVDESSIIEKILKGNSLKDITRSDVFIPSYGESCAFLFGKK